MYKRMLIAASAATAIFSSAAYAFEFGKPIITPVVVTTNKNPQYVSGPVKKNVTLLNFKLTPREQYFLFNSHPKKYAYRSKLSGDNTLPESINLGMNDVPVLDQGYHGTCVTFAITSALDALLKKGDYISQLCNLELGSHLELNGYMASGWWGSFGPWVVDQIQRFGIVSTENQKSRSCARRTEYPTNNFSDMGAAMSLGEFNSMSEDISGKFYPVYYMNFLQRFESRFNDSEQAENVLTTVKKALNRGNRLTFGTFIVISPYCSAGACATYKEKHDTWALTSELSLPPYETGGHEMVIYGYDDNATAVDQEGKEHKGLLMLRNSWGTDVGDHGDYYMTYDYFKKFVGEVIEFVEPRM